MLKSFIVALFSITLSVSPIAQAKSSSSSSYSSSKSYSSPSRSSSYGSGSSSKSYSFGGSSSSSSRGSSSSFFGSSTPRSTPAPTIKYESRKSDALVQKGDSSAKFYSTKKMEQDMASAGIKQKESVIATNKALNSMSQPKVAPQAPAYQGYAYSRPPVTTYQSSAQPRTVIVEKHYHNDGPGLGTIIAGNMIGNALSRPHTPAPVVINNGNGGYQGQGNYPNQYQQNCSAFDGSCTTSKYHFVNGIDF